MQQISRGSLLWIGFGPKFSPTTSTAFNLARRPIGYETSHVSLLYNKPSNNVPVFHVYVPTNPLMARAIKPLLLLDCPVDPIIFFRYKDHSPSYRFCTLFVSSSNHRGLDWKSVDTDADVARPRNYA